MPENIAGATYHKTVGVFLTLAFAKVSNALIALVLARLLSVAGYGDYAFVMAWLTLLTVPCLLGFGVLSVREVSRFAALEQFSSYRGFVAIAVSTITVMTLGVTSAGLAIVALFEDRFAAGQAELLGVGLFFLPVIAITIFLSEFLRGLQHPVLGQSLSSVLRPIVFMISIALVFFVHGGLSAETAVIMYGISYSFSFIVGLFWAYRYNKVSMFKQDR